MAWRDPSTEREPVIYWVDRQDTIVRVNDAWNAFAVQNDAPELVDDRVTGEPLWRFVADSTTRHLYHQLMARARDGVTLKFELRCDSPQLKRRLHMTLSPEGDAVRYESRVAAVNPGAGLAIWQRDTHRRADFVRVCSWCKRIATGDGWVDVEEAIKHNNMFEQPYPPNLTHGICPQCQDGIQSLFRDRRA